jgi:hypothetical protein
MTNKSPGEASSCSKEEDKHPLLRKDITIANFDSTKGIFTVGQQQWTIHNANKTASIQYNDLHLLRKVCIPLKLKNQKGMSCRNRTECLWGLANPTALSTNLASTRGPTINYLRLTNVIVDPTVKPTIMKMYGKGLTKDEQPEKKKPTTTSVISCSRNTTPHPITTRCLPRLAPPFPRPSCQIKFNPSHNHEESRQGSRR